MKRSFFVFILILVPLLCLEGLGRIYIHLVSGNELRDHYSGGKIFEIYPPAYVKLRENSVWNEYQINQDGLLGDSFSDAPAGTTKILAIGGSTSFYGNYMQSLKKAYQSLPEARSGVRFSSAGTPGYVSYQSLINFQTRMLDLKPDIIVIYHAINDLLPLTLRGVDPNDFDDFTAKNTSVLGSSANYRDGILDQSAFYTLLYNRILGVKRAYLAKSYDEQDLLELTSFAVNIESLVAMAKAKKIKVVLTTFAHNQVTEGSKSTWGMQPLVAKGIDSHNKTMQALAVKHNTAMVDVAASLTGQPEYFGDFCHFSDTGITKLTQLMAPTVFGLINDQ